MDNLFQELKRRNVFKVGVAYLVLGWLIIEITDTVFPQFEFPLWTNQFVTLLVMLGFPIAVFLAWAFEVTPEGVKRESELNREASITKPRLNRFLFISTAAVVVATSVIGYRLWDNKTELQTDRSGIPRVAVLYFDNRSDDSEDQYFSKGLSEDIATALSRSAVLSVIPPRIAAAVSTSNDVEAADALRARYLVRGSVTRSDNDVLVSARLVDPENGTVLWGDDYRADLVAANLFDVQATIAARIAATLADATGVVVNIELQDIRQRPASSVDAYACVLRGLAYVAIHTPATHRAARDCLDNVVNEIDPNYADAWAHLSYLYQEEYHHNINVKPESLERALDAGLRAIEIDPSNAMGLFALALTRFNRGQLDIALNQMEHALDLHPNDTMLLSGFAVYAVYAGDIERGLELVERIRNLSPTPLNWIYGATGAAHYLRGEYEQAFIELSNWSPSISEIEILKAASLGMLGRNEEARQVLDALMTADAVFKADPGHEIRRYFMAPATMNAILEGLSRAGLQVELEAPPQIVQ